VRRWFWGGIVVFCTLLGGAGSIVTFVPRPSISLIDSVDPDNPFSSRFTISNSGVIPLTDVSVGIHPQVLLVGNGEIESPKREKGDAATTFTIVRPEWEHLHLGADESLQIPLSEIFSPDVINIGGDYRQFRGGDLSIIVKYRPWLIPIQRVKELRVVAHREPNGKFYWNSIPPN
jgi:hypothetical protein